MLMYYSVFVPYYVTCKRIHFLVTKHVPIGVEHTQSDVNLVAGIHLLHKEVYR